MTEKWVIISYNDNVYGPFDTPDDAYAWCYKKWPAPDDRNDRKIRVKRLLSLAPH